MKIFGINFTTKKELNERIAELEAEVDMLEEEIMDIVEDFPFFIGQTVYDVALKDAHGRYTKKKPSLEYSTITPVVVDHKNYFKLVERYERSDVFDDEEDAIAYLRNVCA